VLFVAIGAGLWVAIPRGSEASAQPYALSLVVNRPAGPPVMLQFQVSASSAAHASAAANSAVAQLIPDGSLASPGEVSGQWLPWGWKWDTHELPVPVAYNPTDAPISVGPQVVVAGLQAWSTVPTSSFAFRYAGVTENVASILESGPDGENVVSWQFIDCELGCVLGVASKELGHEVDMVLNSNPDAAGQLGVGSAVDWRTVILHELGHMAGLEHSCPVPFGPCSDEEADAVMYFQYRGMQRKLAADDIAGISALYPANQAPIPTPTSVPGSPLPPVPEFPVIIEPGWNFVVLPAGPVEAFAGSLTCASAVYTFDQGEWRAWIRGLSPQLQALSVLDAHRGYWVFGAAGCAHIF